MKKNYCLFLLFSLFLAFNVHAASIKEDSATIYALGETYNNKLSIPSELKKEFQITVLDSTENPKYKVISGNSVLVSENGLVTPKVTTYYCKENVCSTSNSSSYDRTYQKVEVGTSKISVVVGSETFEVNVNVVDYAVYSAEKKMKDFVDENIRSNMNDYEKMETIVKDFIRYYPYSAKASNYIDFIYGDGADCIGISEAVIYMANYAGIKAHLRNAIRDAGAGNNHHNVAALLDGKIYVIDATYNESPPRYYKIENTYSGFSTGINGGQYIYIQYDGYDEVVEIPNNYQVLGEYAFLYGKNKYTVVKNVKVPTTLTEIRTGAFMNIPTLKEINVDASNPNYMSEDGILYSKTGDILYQYPSGKEGGVLKIKDGVKEIKEYAVSYNNNISSLELNEDLQVIDDNAFYDLDKLTKGVIIPKSVTKIGNNVFSKEAFDPDNNLRTYNNGDYVNYLVILNENTTLGKGLCSKYFPIYGYKNSTAINYAQENNCAFGVIEEGQTEFKEITDLDISVSDMEISGDVNIPEIVIKDNGKILEENVDYKVSYVKNNMVTDYAQAWIIGIDKYVGIKMEEFKITKIDITRAVIENLKEYYEWESYDNNIEPEIVVKLDGKILEKNKDYRVSYSNTYRPGTAKLVIKGSGDYTGEITKEYQIVSPYTLKLSLPQNISLPKGSTMNLLLTVTPNLEITPTWKSSYNNIVGIDDSGKITAKEVGKSVITASYKGVSATTTINVLDYIKGDLDESGDISVIDAVEALYYSIGKREVTSHKLLIGDFDNDEEITVIDAIEILKLLIK